MIRKSIAAFVLVMLCWLSAPIAFGSLAAAALHSARRSPSRAQDHSCCPRSRGKVAPVLFVAMSFTAMPCGAQHPCCAKQKPGSPSIIPVETRVVRPEAGQALANVSDTPSSGFSRVNETSVVCFRSPPFERNTVLRI